MQSLEHPANQRVVAFLAARAASGQVACARPDEFEDPYYQLGGHPDVVERIWDQLGGALDGDCRRVVYGVPALACPATGLVLAVALGPTYGLRIHASDQPEARALGIEQDHDYSSEGVQLSLRECFGPDWFFGGWHERETAWCQHSFSSPDRPRRARDLVAWW